MRDFEDETANLHLLDGRALLLGNEFTDAAAESVVVEIIFLFTDLDRNIRSFVAVAFRDREQQLEQIFL